MNEVDRVQAPAIMVINILPGPASAPRIRAGRAATSGRLDEVALSAPGSGPANQLVCSLGFPARPDNSITCDSRSGR